MTGSNRGLNSRYITTGRVSNPPLPSHSLVTLQYYDVEPLVLSQLEYDEQADANLSPLPSRERARACPVLDTGVRANYNIKTMLTRY